MRKALLIVASIGLLLSFIFVWWRHDINALEVNKDYFVDVAGLYPTKVSAVRKESQVEDLVEIVREANETGQKISIAGSQHSQGGHTYYPDGIVLNMREFNEILEIDKETKTITVQSGATWAEIQSALQPYGLAVKVMQSSNIFTVGGTLSANAHGRDLSTTTFVESVKSFRLLQADGSIVNVSREENDDLFRLVVGGYGLFGVILDTTLEVTDDVIYQLEAFNIGYKDFPDHFKNEILSDQTAVFMLVRPSVDIRADDFLRSMAVSVWHTTDHTDDSLFALQGEKHVLRDTLAFDLSRRFDWAKSWRWRLQESLVEKGGQKYVSRNNAMRPPVAPLDFLQYRARNRADIIQEYYVPTDSFIPFMDELREVILQDDVNIISSTIRYVKANNEVAWSHTPQQDSFAIIIMSNISTDEAGLMSAESTTRKLVDLVISHGGTYYLTYQLFPTKEQLSTAYPETASVFAAKKQYDPNETFTSLFYEQYAHGVNQLEELFK